jgi:hypothetical protein
MNNITQLYPANDIPTALRNIAEAYERGELSGDDCTIIMGDDVFILGQVPEKNIVERIVFNLRLGEYLVMNGWRNQ